MHYHTIFDNYKNDIRNTWKSLRPLIGKARDKTVITNEFIHNGKSISNPTEICNSFCDFFVILMKI